jgi:hypothetical protein
MVERPHGRRSVDQLLSDLDRVLQFRKPVRTARTACDPPGRHLPQVHLRGGEPYKVTCKQCPAVWHTLRGDDASEEVKP